ncbi:Hypothetical protein PHPALM_9727 [Phytophthora palmivora]|uniref:Uncharacterized protein n=1 Tax=Phytophthora palmivora TaxID=4796 RepID=A0A2P4Y6K1_9STRA|nr:Hypothetical protein PHPALM_9727 [Phytophthora palmivora]
MDPVSTLVMEQGERHHNEHIQLARLITFALTQPPEPSDSTQRQAILQAESASALVDILRGQYQPPNLSADLAQLRVDLHSAEASNASLQKRLGSSLVQVAQLKLQLETSERECHLRKREVDKSVGLVTSLRKALTASGAELKQARAAQTAEVTATQSALHAAELMIKSRDEDITALSRSIVERDEAYKILQGVSAKHFQQLQEIVLSLDDDGFHKLRHAKKTIDEMRETILRQKRVISPGLSSTSPSPTKKHRKGKKKHKHKHKHKAKAKAAHKGRHKSKREDRHKGRRKETKSQAKRPRSPSPGGTSASDSGAPLKKHKVSARSPAATNSATDSAAGPEPSPNSAGGSGPSLNSAGMILPSQLSVSIAVLRTRAMQSASRDSRITPHQGEFRWSLTVLDLEFE